MIILILYKDTAVESTTLPSGEKKREKNLNANANKAKPNTLFSGAQVPNGYYQSADYTYDPDDHEANIVLGSIK